jgi:hypothetical protein
MQQTTRTTDSAARLGSVDRMLQAVRYASFLAIGLALVTLTGCQTSGLRSDLAAYIPSNWKSSSTPTAAAPSEVEVPRPAPDPVLSRVADMETNRAEEVVDGEGRRVRVVAGAAYHAASGRICRPFTVTIVGGAGAGEQRLACETDYGDLESVDLVINPDSLRGPSRLPVPRRSSS